MAPAATTATQIRELVAAGRAMFRHSPLSDVELERLAARVLTLCDAPATCLRCHRPVLAERQVCPERTPASVFCWTEGLESGELEIQPGLRLRPGGSGVPLQIVEDPYAI